MAKLPAKIAAKIQRRYQARRERVAKILPILKKLYPGSNVKTWIPHSAWSFWLLRSFRRNVRHRRSTSSQDALQEIPIRP